MVKNARSLFRQPIRFAVVGVINTFVGLSVIYLCKYALDMSDVPANIAGYVIGLQVSFLLNARWTFEYSGAMLVAAFKFILVFLVSYGLNLTTVLVFIKIVGVNSYLAQALGVPIYTVAFYLLSKALVFRPN